MKQHNIILADGRFPSNKIALSYLNNAAKIICCDGAVFKLEQYGLQPDVIIGDMDSISSELKEKYAHLIKKDPDQNSNDLTKAVNYCVDNDLEDVVILGATGLREDHAIGNISLLVAYSNKIKVNMITNHGTFTSVNKSTRFSSFKGQQVSIFSLDTNVNIVSDNLKFPLKGVVLDTWWKGTLNESEGDAFSLSFETGKRLIIFQTHVSKSEELK